MALIAEDCFKCVLVIGRKETSNWIATGFICTKKIGEHRYHFIVTNEHVFENETVLYIRLYNKKSNKFESLRLDLKDKDGKKAFTAHPVEDVAAKLLAGGFLERAGFGWKGFDIDDGMKSSKEYFEAGGSVGSRVFMLGFPMGLD